MKFPYSITANALAELIDAELVMGKKEYANLNGINEIHKVEAGDVSFVDHPKYYQKCLQSAAWAVIINSREVQNAEGKTLLVHPDPIGAYNKIVAHYQPHLFSTANIAPTAKVGKGTIIEAGAIIGEGAVIGKNCHIFPNVYIAPTTIIGDHVVVQAGSVIGNDAFYYKNRPETGYDRLLSSGRVLLQDNVEIGAGCTISRGVSGDTIIGEGSKLDSQCHIGHGVVLGKNCLLAAQVAIAGKTIIGNRVIIWGQVGINKSLRIADDVVIGARSGVGRSLLKSGTYLGDRAMDMPKALKIMAANRQLPKVLLQLKQLEKEIEDLKNKAH